MDSDEYLMPALGTKLSCILFPLPSNEAFFPGEALPLPVEDERIAWPLRQALAHGNAYLLAIPRREVRPGDSLDMPFEETGTLMTFQLLELPMGESRVMLEGVCRARLLKLADAQNSLEGEVEIVPDTLTNKGHAEEFSLKTGDVRVVPVLPLRNVFIAPQCGAHLFAGRERSIAAIQKAVADALPLLVPLQKDESVDTPEPKDIPEIAALARIPQSLRLPDNTLRFLVRGEEWAKIRRYTDRTEFLEAEVVILDRMIGDALAEADTGEMPAARVYIQSYRKGVPFPFPREIAEKAFAQGFVIAGESPWHLTHFGEDCGYIYTEFARDTVFREPRTIWQLEASHLSSNPRIWNAFITILRETPSVAFWPGLGKVSACVANSHVVHDLPEWVVEHCGRPDVITAGAELAERVIAEQAEASQSW